LEPASQMTELAQLKGVRGHKINIKFHRQFHFEVKQNMNMYCNVVYFDFLVFFHM